MHPTEYALMDAAEDHMWWYRALHSRLINTLADTQGRILDAGCGTGGFLNVVRAQRPDLTCFGLEWDAAAASRARHKSKSYIARGSIDSIPFTASHFDAAISADVLCHAAVDPAAALSELHRILRPGGRLILNLPAYQWLLSAHDQRVHNVRRFTLGTTTAMLRQGGFDQIRTRYWNGLLLPLMIAQRKLLARGNSVSDVAPFPPWLDATLLSATKLEQHLPFPLPAGGSVLAIAEKP